MKRRISVSKEDNAEKIHPFLETDRIWAGYAICDLEEPLFQLCDWYTATEDDKVISICMYFNGLHPPTQISIGDKIGLKKILESIRIPRQIHVHMPINHWGTISKHYNFDELHSMKRMFVTKKLFMPAAGKAEKMGKRDLKDLETLYAAQPGNFFRPYMLASGVYYGLRIGGKLVSAAGTHVCTPSYGLACVGNVFTNPQHRGRGYATVCLSQAVKELLTRYQDVILNVEGQNTSAIKIYRKLGFREHCIYLEASANTVKKL